MGCITMIREKEQEKGTLFLCSRSVAVSLASLNPSWRGEEGGGKTTSNCHPDTPIQRNFAGHIHEA